MFTLNPKLAQKFSIIRKVLDNNNNKRPLTPKSMPPAGDEHAKLKTGKVLFITRHQAKVINIKLASYIIRAYFNTHLRT